MKKPYVWILVAALVLLLVCSIVLLCCVPEFFGSGVHVLGRFAHVDLQQNCYYIESNIVGDEIPLGDKTTFTVSGYLYDPAGTEMGEFNGFMNVKSSPMPYEEAYNSYSGDIQKDVITISNQGLHFIHPQCKTFYIVEILRSDPSVIMIYVLNADGSESAKLICGETQEQATANYREFLKERFGR